MDQDDPENRIADLERQLAERKRGADLPRVSADHAAASRRFEASTMRGTTHICVTSDGLTVDQRRGDVFHSVMRSWAYGLSGGLST